MPIAVYREDGLASSTAIKGPCKAATTANIALHGEQTIDGVSCATGDRVLVKDQDTATENGIYVVDTGNWRRSADFEGNRDVRKGTNVYVHSGAGFGWYRVETTDPIVIDTSSIAFQFTERGDPVLPQANATASDPGYVDLAEATANGANKIRVKGAAALTADREVAFPDKSGTVVLDSDLAGYAQTSALAGYAALGTADQTITGGARVTPLDLGNLSGQTITPDPGDRPIQKVTNNGAGSILPGSNEGQYTLQVINATGAGSITTTGWTLKGDAFDNGTTSKFACSCLVTSDMKLMTVVKVA